MPTTIEQAVEAHKAGKLEEAEALYRAILKDQPKHPDANHNLGVLAASVNKSADALPLLRTALEANPKQRQYWISYIDALIKDNQPETARVVLEQGRKMGLTGEKVDALSQQLTPRSKEPELYKAQSPTFTQQRKKFSAKKEKKKNASPSQRSLGQTSSPSQAEVNALLTQYQSGQYAVAEKLAVAMSQKYPNDHFAWKVLGAVLRASGRLPDAVVANQKALALVPNDVEAHSNLGTALHDLGRLAEAEASYRQAIALKPDFAEAHYNLGATLRDLGRLEDTEASYRQAIALKPDFAEAHYNLGVTLMALGRPEEAEASYRQAIALKPDYAEAHSNLGNTLQTLERFDEAEESYNQVIALKPENIKVHSRLLMCLFQQDKKSAFFDELDYLINQDEANAIIGSLACRSALKYGLEKPNLFCTKPLNYVLHNDLNTRYDFEKIFVEKAKSILNENQISNRRQILLVNGNQTSGNIFDIKNDDTKEIQNIIRFEVEKYQTKFKESEEGLIKKMPAEYSLHGWLISMKSGGNLKPHIHTEGWLSGSIYINIPRKLKVDSGNLVVALGRDNDPTDTRINEKKTITVVTGSMVLFPASLMHYTIPFESEEERIVLAFDVKEK